MRAPACPSTSRRTVANDVLSGGGRRRSRPASSNGASDSRRADDLEPVGTGVAARPVRAITLVPRQRVSAGPAVHVGTAQALATVAGVRVGEPTQFGDWRGYQPTAGIVVRLKCGSVSRPSDVRIPPSAS